VKKPIHRFALGNNYYKRRMVRAAAPTNPVDMLDRIVTDALNRVARREYEEVERPDGKVRRKLRPLDASRANAVGNLARVKLEIYSMYGAGEALRQLQGELEQMKEVVARLLQERAR